MGEDVDEKKNVEGKGFHEKNVWYRNVMEFPFIFVEGTIFILTFIISGSALYYLFIYRSKLNAQSMFRNVTPTNISILYIQNRNIAHESLSIFPS